MGVIETVNTGRTIRVPDGARTVPSRLLIADIARGHPDFGSKPGRKFRPLFDGAHELYLQAFPPEVREPKQTIEKYIRWASDPEEGYNFHYLAAFCLHFAQIGRPRRRVQLPDVVGMQSFDVLTIDNGASARNAIQFVCYTATASDYRRQGIATELTNAGVTIACESTPEGYSLAYRFSESDPLPPPEQASFLQNVGGYGIMSVETSQGIVPVSYEQPRRVKNQDSVPLNANLATVQDGKIVKSDGIQQIGKAEAHAVLKTVLDFYTDEEPDFVVKDARRILRTVETQLSTSKGEFAYLVPQTEAIRQ